MRGKDMLEAIENLEPAYIEAAEEAPKAKRNGWLRWGAVAACLCLVVGIAIPILHPKGGPDSQQPGVPEIHLLYLNGALYEFFDTPKTLERLGLPKEITPEMAGEHVAYIEQGGPVEYQETAGQTDKELFQYAPAPSRAVYVLRDGEKYMAVVFVRVFFPDDPNAYCDLAEVYRFFNIEDAGDISSIAQVDWNRGRVTGAEVTDADAIAAFYEMTTDIVSFVSMDDDAFQKRVFSGIPEENAQEAYNAFADDLQILRIETGEGLRFFLNLYPNYDYLYSSQAMAYHLVTPELAEWCNTHLELP